MSRLQPMKMAPKDGTWIIMFADRGREYLPFVCSAVRWERELLLKEGWMTTDHESFRKRYGKPLGWEPMPEELVSDPVEEETCVMCGLENPLGGALCVKCQRLRDEIMKENRVRWMKLGM